MIGFGFDDFLFDGYSLVASYDSFIKRSSFSWIWYASLPHWNLVVTVKESKELMALGVNVGKVFRSLYLSLFFINQVFIKPFVASAIILLISIFQFKKPLWTKFILFILKLVKKNFNSFSIFLLVRFLCFAFNHFSRFK